MSSKLEAKLPPELERIVVELAAYECKESCSALTLVARRFHAWSESISFHSVVISSDRIVQVLELLPYARHIRILAIDVTTWQISEDDQHRLKLLLERCSDTIHLCISWGIWNNFTVQCGVMPLQSLCLLWLSEGQQVPSLDYLQHPAQLQHLICSSPPDLQHPGPLWYRWAKFALQPSQLSRFTNLTKLTYATDREILDLHGFNSLETMVLVLLGREKSDYDRYDDVQSYRQLYGGPQIQKKFIPSQRRDEDDWSFFPDGTEKRLGREWLKMCEGRDNNMWDQ